MTQSLRPRILVVAGLALFVAALGYLVASSLARRAAPAFPPSPVGQALGWGDGPDTVTVDARDTEAWRYLDLDGGVALAPGDSAGWDLAVRRFRIRGREPVRTVRHARLEPAGFTAPSQPAEPPGYEVGRWYRYGMLSHLLEPSGRVHLLRTDQGRRVLAEIVSYYCTGLAAGCLTLRVQREPGGSPPR